MVRKHLRDLNLKAVIQNWRPMINCHSFLSGKHVLLNQQKLTLKNLQGFLPFCQIYPLLFLSSMLVFSYIQNCAVIAFMKNVLENGVQWSYLPTKSIFVTTFAYHYIIVIMIAFYISFIFLYILKISIKTKKYIFFTHWSIRCKSHFGWLGMLVLSFKLIRHWL